MFDVVSASMVAVEFQQLKNPHIITSSLTISSVLLAVSVLTVKIKLCFRSGSFLSIAIFALLGLAWTVAVSLTVSVLLTVSASPMVDASLTTFASSTVSALLTISVVSRSLA